MAFENTMPPQQLSYKSKTKAWRKKVVDYADSKSLYNYSPVRKSVRHKKINYDLMNGIIHMSDLMDIVNPENLNARFIADKVTHYPIMNSKLDVLKGEELSRVFDYRVVVTNPTAISEIEENKKNQLFERLQQMIQNKAQSEDEFNRELEKLSQYYTYEWQDLREIRANALLNHYSKQYNMPLLFNQGFSDAMTVGEEIYQCSIVGGEPVIERVNPMKIRVFRSGYSNKIEDADMIILEDFWSPGRIIDTYGEVLKPKDLEYINNLPNNQGSAPTDKMDNVDDRYGLINTSMIDDQIFTDSLFENPQDDDGLGLLPFDSDGNIRVMRVYWKSRRKIKKIKYYDPETGQEEYKLRTEDYEPNVDIGEEETTYWINEAWEGTKIGNEVYVNMRPCQVQYNKLGNPSACHFGIIGSIYNLNDSKPFSLVDMMKQYNYFYDVIHDRLNRMIAKNYGKMLRLDFAKVPRGWDIEKWLYYARTNNLVVEDSFNEGTYGSATGKLAGGMNNASSGVIDAELGTSIQQLINLLEFIKLEMSEVVGITKQREGQISNRETVGGVERATLQSSHITERIFAIHDDIKRRALECFLETAKIAMKGRNKKFQYILSDNSQKIGDIDGDEFAECDYGLVVDNGKGLQELNQKLDMLAQAALQNQTASLSTIMKIYNSSSIQEKERMIERDEQMLREQQQEQARQQLEAQQQQAQMQLEQEQQELLLKDQMNQRDNETKILIATMQQQNQADNDGIIEPEYSQEAKDKLMEQMREFDQQMSLERKKFEFEKQKHKEDNQLKDEISKRQARTRAKSNSK